jgi:hypothetical protein
MIYDTVLSQAASAEDPIAGGRHKVWGSVPLWVLPQTSTIASQLPKAVELRRDPRRAPRREVTHTCDSIAYAASEMRARTTRRLGRLTRRVGGVSEATRQSAGLRRQWDWHIVHAAGWVGAISEATGYVLPGEWAEPSIHAVVDGRVPFASRISAPEVVHAWSCGDGF